MRAAVWYWLPFVVFLGQGCANVHVKKVPLDARAEGQDDHIRGFRYYLSRPYVVLKARIDLGTVCEEVQEVAVRKAGTSEQLPAFLSRFPDPDTHQPRLYSAEGQLLDPLEWQAFQRAELLPPPHSITPAAYQEKKKADPMPGPTAPVPSNPSSYVITVPPAKPGDGDAKPGKDDLANNIQVVFLPDFEEQYAVQPCNIAAKTNFELHFTDGWQLDSTTASLDATDVPIAILTAIRNALKLSGASQQKSATQTPAKGGAKDEGAPPLREPSYGRLVAVRTFFLEPGMYRVQKSWERCTPSGEHGLCTAVCLLTNMGLEVHEEVSILPQAQANCPK